MRKAGKKSSSSDKKPTLSLMPFEGRLSPDLTTRFQSLTSPVQIQAYLDSLPYVAEELDRSPLRVLQDRQAHCLDGAIFAALALSRLGYPPIIMDLVPAPGKDDDHVLALFEERGHWGCIAKSNYAGLRYREAVYHSLRELSMSYFDFFFNNLREKTLRGYTRPLNLSAFPPNWMWSEVGVAQISRKLYSRRPISLISSGAAARLSRVDDRSFRSSTLDTDFSWIFGVRKA
jgi:hypothetical protein